MSRGWMVYILMLVVAVAGLWVILLLGRGVSAPDDLTGNWTVEWETPPPAPAAAPPSALPPAPSQHPAETLGHDEVSRMHVAQSGRFFTVRFGQADPLGMTLEPGWRGQRQGRQLKMRLIGGPWQLELEGTLPTSAPGAAGDGGDAGATGDAGAAADRMSEIRLVLEGPTRHVGLARRVREQTAADGAAPADAQTHTDTPDPQPIPADASPTAHAR